MPGDENKEDNVGSGHFLEFPDICCWIDLEIVMAMDNSGGDLFLS